VSLDNHGRNLGGDVQVISAGTGILQSEYNLEDEPTSIFQIWIMPGQRWLPPSWGTRAFPREDRAGAIITLASGLENDPAEALPIRADARLAAATLMQGRIADYHLAPGRKVYMVPATGAIEVNGVLAEAGDGVA